MEKGKEVGKIHKRKCPFCEKDTSYYFDKTGYMCPECGNEGTLVELVLFLLDKIKEKRNYGV